jgi:aspartyl-tRNA(Asn)/glutamyl-tRNA(Gln) amidotransferase subunit C
MTREEVQKIAELAQLQFTEEELKTFADEFSRIVDYVGTIGSVDMTNVEPLSSVSGQTMTMRDDVAGECLTTDEALANAPKKNDAFFKVPKVL